ncbi:helix-turn-helix transcriptional regulator [Nocardia vinacea]|uniref:Helix-turn-helix transcriptional regulator n=1 Tax=Nocardia vinacea TaxID=96468 RepID=A0ABZ1YZU3_9NOCA|nr:helix-turn-helix transcriptional regulator [Nocardia vinacea]
MNISERTLRRRFRSATGMIWRDFLVQARLIRAMVALAQPGVNILEVAMSVGFGSASAFSRAFRTFAGCTPVEYRHRVAVR